MGGLCDCFKSSQWHRQRLQGGGRAHAPPNLEGWEGTGEARAFLSCAHIQHACAYATTWCKLWQARERLTLGYLQPRKRRHYLTKGKKYTPCYVTRLRMEELFKHGTLSELLHSFPTATKQPQHSLATTVPPKFEVLLAPMSGAGSL